MRCDDGLVTGRPGRGRHSMGGGQPGETPVPPAPGAPPPPVTEPNPDPADEPPPVIEPDPEAPDPAPEPPPMVARAFGTALKTQS